MNKRLIDLKKELKWKKEVLINAIEEVKDIEFDIDQIEEEIEIEKELENE